MGLLFQEYGVSFFPDVTPLHSTGILKALTSQVRTALQERNQWGQLLQEFTRYLLWNYCKSLREIRRLAFTGDWHVCCTPPAYGIYAMYHLYYSVVYIGITTSPPIKRFRKHLTDSLAHTHAASLHEFMARSNIEDWAIAPPEYVSTS